MAQDQKYALQITRKGVVVWIGLFFFVMGWMFVLGILVGRGTAPVPLGTHALEKELAALKEARLQQEQDQREGQAKSAENKNAELGFYEALKMPPPKTLPARTAPPAVKPPGPAPAKAPPPVAAAPPAAESRPAPVPAAKTVQEAAPPSRDAQTAEDRGRFTIQVAAFREAQSAERLVAELRAKGYPAYQIRMTVQDKGEWFRVRVGAFESREESETMLRKLNGDKVQGMVIGTN